MSFAKLCCLAGAVCMLLCGCGDNLAPSGQDNRLPVIPGTTGPGVGQKAPDFAVTAVNGTSVTLASALSGRTAAVFYFTMWCPICDTHMSSMRSAIPAFPSVGFYLVDYVSGSVAAAADAEAANGYSGSGFTTLADTGHQLLTNLQGTMGTTVVIDANGIIRMNEDYRDGSRLRSILSGLN